jgi:hypothetical protein
MGAELQGPADRLEAWETWEVGPLRVLGYEPTPPRPGAAVKCSHTYSATTRSDENGEMARLVNLAGHLGHTGRLSIPAVTALPNDPDTTRGTPRA